MPINIAIGFVTGRKHFQNVLTTYINNWIEHGLIIDKNVRIHLFVAYDLKYRNTNPEDFKNIDPEIASVIDSIHFYGRRAIEEEKENIIQNGVLNSEEVDLIFGDGYAKKRNAVLYFAIKLRMDRLIFLDDDEYPIAVTKNKFDHLIWMGQSVVGYHVKYSSDADITHGHHCGYISPIPQIPFDKTLTETDFKRFIKALSNEIVSWKTVRKNIIENGGVTYADTKVLNKKKISEVKEEYGMKFISGANLCFNLKKCRKKLPPFYNPPGARGEDTFMSTALSDLKVLKIPVYTFHDGFLNHKHLLRGILSTSLEPVKINSPNVVKRFTMASIGWIRYKPLMVYITQRKNYDQIISQVRKDLELSVPKFCKYFHTDQFNQILTELKQYDKNVIRHFNSFQETKRAWFKLIQKTAGGFTFSDLEKKYK